MHRELVAEAADVGADRRVADPQVLRDLAAREAFGHEAQDLLLPRRQPLELGLDRPALGDQSGDGARGDEHLAPRHVADRGDHVGGGPRLVEERARARLHRREPGRVSVLARQEDHLRRGPDAANRRGRIRTGPVRQPEVQEHDFGVQLGGGLHAVGDRADVADHLHVGLVVDQRGQAFRHDTVVFDDQHPGRFVVSVVVERIVGTFFRKWHNPKTALRFAVPANGGHASTKAAGVPLAADA